VVLVVEGGGWDSVVGPRICNPHGLLWDVMRRCTLLLENSSARYDGRAACIVPLASSSCRIVVTVNCCLFLSSGLKTGYLRKKKVSSWKSVGWKKRCVTVCQPVCVDVSVRVFLAVHVERHVRIVCIRVCTLTPAWLSSCMYLFVHDALPAPCALD
jgi:hypothetical protein